MISITALPTIELQTDTCLYGINMSDPAVICILMSLQIFEIMVYQHNQKYMSYIISYRAHEAHC